MSTRASPSPSPQLPPPGQEFDLTGLVDAANALCGSLPRPADGRVSGRVDVRLVRYYQSAALLEAPLRYEGRSAVYGQQHLADLVCIRALQARGFALGQIQAAIAAMPSAGRVAAADEALRGAAMPMAPAGAPQTSPAAAATTVLQPGLRCELAPGVEVWIDPARVPAAAALADALRAAVTAHLEQSR